MQDLFSGYDSTHSDWRRFLLEWSLKCGSDISISLIGGMNGSNGVTEEVIRLNCQRLGLDSLPKSYVDFLKNYSVDEKYPGLSLCAGQGVLLPVDKIDYLHKIDQQMYGVIKEVGEDTVGPDYFKYGLDMDNACFNASFADKFIVIGRSSLNDYVYLNPCVETVDGEFECILDCPGFAIRTLSFAGMMRYMYVYECGEFDHYPPYPDWAFEQGTAALIKTKF